MRKKKRRDKKDCEGKKKGITTDVRLPKEVVKAEKRFSEGEKGELFRSKDPLNAKQNE